MKTVYLSTRRDSPFLIITGFCLCALLFMAGCAGPKGMGVDVRVYEGEEVQVKDDTTNADDAGGVDKEADAG